MKLLNKDLKEYQRLCKKYFDESVTENEAREQLTLLVRQMEIVYRPVTKVQFDRYIEKHISESDDNEPAYIY